MDNEVSMGHRWLNWAWYFVFVVGLSSYTDTGVGVLFVAVLWGLFKAIEYFFTGSKLSFVVKTITILAILYRTGTYGSFFNPLWLYNLGIQIGYDFNYFYLGYFHQVKVVPVVFNTLFFLFFKEVIIAKPHNGRFTLFVTFAGGSLLLFLSIWSSMHYTILTFLFILIGIIKMVFDNMQASKFKYASSNFTATIIFVIFMCLVLVWNTNAPLTFAQEFEYLRTRFEGGFSPVDGDGEGGAGEVKKSGYSSNDNILGGSIEMSLRPTLRMRTETPIYLRGETKYLYTGRGWTDDIITREEFHINNLPFNRLPGVDYETLEIEIEVLNGTYAVVFASLNTSKVKMERGNTLSIVNGSDLFTETFLRQGDIYQITVENPIYTDAILRGGGDYPSDFPLRQYTGLPASLPQSIKDLALEITQGLNNDYDKALAIKNYLTSREFAYSLNVDYPPSDMDFVEHFLEIKQGYCVHYSTAFVVLARAVGIPSRWVKGFTYGTFTGQGVYTVADKDAHAWAEVYLPQAGWITFEATPGFRIDAPSETGGENPDAPGEDEPGDDDDDDLFPGEDPINNDGGDNTPIAGGSSNVTGILMGVISSVVLLIVMVLFTILNKRNKILTPKDKVVRLYNKVIQKFKRLGVEKRSYETPREYIARTNSFKWLPTQFLKDLTHRFEHAYYGDNIVVDEDIEDLSKEQKKYNIIRLTLGKITSFLK